MINHIWAILWKQLKDTLKNKAILIQFLMFPSLGGEADKNFADAQTAFENKK